ncbi:hypothetical protein CJ030_MR2G023451 [Morella rubra]|uniref:Pentacotripeptide-repeat region of PRORP domain-containing protein n=1 Tax=Morella rubra TaxID=262757 RepID=A0A6A1WEN7_9ROSI|nr:hypothetical protein CJ030_MR2G023426 [Morella rubra]KAB1222213.1 hypothetical protein CJ030_MR2G023451 [Morella rubra]
MISSRECFAKLEIASSCIEDDKVGTLESPQGTYDRCLSLKRFYHATYASSKFSFDRHSFSSQAGAKSSGEEDDLEDGFSELETPSSPEANQDSNIQDENDDELISEPEVSDDDVDGEEPSQNELELLDIDTNPSEKRARQRVSLAMLNLRKRKMFGRALQLSEWLEANKRLEFIERDYASRLDLIAKVRGLQKAENYVEKIPKSFRGEKENVKPTLFTYKLLIDTKGQSNDITGMDQIVETMKAEGIEPDIPTQAIIAKHYASGGLKDKAEAILKEIEGDNLKDRWAIRVLLPLYAQLGMADDVSRLWKACESSPGLEDCMAAIDAWGKLKKINEAEAVFDRMVKTWKTLNSRHYSVILRVYANNKMLTKGKDLVKRMAESGCRIGPLTWDALVRLYVEAGEVEKADSILQKATQQSQMKAMFSSYMAIMEQYAKRGDIHNSEKMFNRIRQAGYVGRGRQFQALVQAYINAKVPAYGIRERMKADNLFPNKSLAAQLIQVDAFRKTAVSDLLD